MGDPRLPQLEPAQLISVRAHVYAGLRRAVLDGRFATGEQLNERGLAGSFGVSTTPVKEALRQLQAEGLVRSDARRGVFVTFGRAQAEEMVLARAALERSIAGLAARRAGAAGLAPIDAALAVMQAATAGADAAALIAGNAAFHRAIHQASGCVYLPGLLDGQAIYDEAIRAGLMARQDEQQRALAEHTSIRDRIAAADAPGAERAMHDHVMRSGRLYLDCKFSPNQTPDTRSA